MRIDISILGRGVLKALKFYFQEKRTGSLSPLCGCFKMFGGDRPLKLTYHLTSQSVCLIMKIPAIKGIIRRRILLNYRVSPEVVAALLPPIFRPKVVQGYAIAGICLIRLEEILPKGFPALPGLTGFSSENSAHRFAVKWRERSGANREGVYISRRDTDSKLNSVVGGYLFPGVHHFSDFSVHDENGQISLQVKAKRQTNPLIDFEALETSVFPESSVFLSVGQSSRFFEAGSVGYSSRPNSKKLDGLELQIPDWTVSSLRVNRIQSSFFDDTTLFPAGSIEFDHALLMRDLPHEWHAQPEMSSKPRKAKRVKSLLPVPNLGEGVVTRRPERGITLDRRGVR